MKSRMLLIPGVLAAAVAVALVAPCGRAEDKAPPTTQPNDGLVEIKIKLPKPAFAGTPKPKDPTVRLDPKGQARGAFRAPAGTINLALKKPVTSSDENPVIGNLALVTDGDKEATDGSWVELGPMVQWVQIDLKEPSKIYGVLFWHYHGEARVYRDVVVQVADDPDFVKNVRTLFNNDADNSAGLGVGNHFEYVELNEGKLVEAPGGTVARYVRLYSNGSTSDGQNLYTEVEVYGMPEKK